MELKVYIERDGDEIEVGTISSTVGTDASFRYSQSYLNSGCRAISLNLPLQQEGFTAEKTKIFFDGLLPEGFTRRAVAGQSRVFEDDYISILSILGKECMGAIRISDESETQHIENSYRKISNEELRALAIEGASKSAEIVTKTHLSLAGASGKVGLYYDGNDWFLPVGRAPSTHIVKQSHVRLRDIVINEQLCLITAKNLGLDVVDSFVVKCSGTDESNVLFATNRYDRKFVGENRMVDGMMVPKRLHQEDFAQGLGILSSEKYEAPGGDYMSDMFKLIKRVSGNPLADQLKLWDAIVFNYLIGNTDGHVKNFSLLYDENLTAIRLAPLYDIVSTVVYPESARHMAFSIGGETLIDKISRENFRDAAKRIGASEKILLERFDDLSESFEKALNIATEQLESEGLINAPTMRDLILKGRNL